MNLENYKILFEKNQRENSLPSWLVEKQNLAFEIFSKNGFPTLKDEEWRFTDISQIEKTDFKYSENVETNLELIKKYSNDNWNLIPIVNGRIIKNSILLKDKIKIENIYELSTETEQLAKKYFSQSNISYKDSISSLNTALLNDIYFISIEKGIEIKHPIHILNIQTSSNIVSINTCRLVFSFSEEAKATIFEEFVSENENVYWNNSITEYFVSKNAKIEHIKLQNEKSNAYHFSNSAFYQQKNSFVNSVNISLGANISRNETKIFLCDADTDTSLNGLYISSKKQIIDNHTFIEHKKENCNSHELFKGILFDESRAVFNGKIYVYSEAQKTDSKQTNKNLLLSNNATIDTKPQLEIFADDVKCTHGGTVGGLDKISLFYLESRGVNLEVAKGILIIGFASEVTELIENKIIRQKIDDLIVKKIRDSIGNINLPEIVHHH